jgi:hypothetical protein
MNEETNNGEVRWHKFGQVQVYARRDDEGQLTRADAIDEDEGRIRALADQLQHAGYGVLRERVPRAGRVFHRLRALWVGPGEPPEDPFGTI